MPFARGDLVEEVHRTGTVERVEHETEGRASTRACPRRRWRTAWRRSLLLTTGKVGSFFLVCLCGVCARGISATALLFHARYFTRVVAAPRGDDAGGLPARTCTRGGRAGRGGPATPRSSPRAPAPSSAGRPPPMSRANAPASPQVAARPRRHTAAEWANKRHRRPLEYACINHVACIGPR